MPDLLGMYYWLCFSGTIKLKVTEQWGVNGLAGNNEETVTLVSLRSH